MRICEVNDCQRKHKAHGLCSMHYRRKQKNGLTERPRDGKDCAVHGCKRKCTRHLYCDKHYYRFKNYGDPLIVQERFQVKSYSIEDLFDISYIINSFTNCWEWIGPKNSWGYGRINYGSKHLAAHRYSFERFKEPIPEGKYVCHHCDNPKCVNPEHLFLGDAQSNIDDMVNKGRHIGCRKLKFNDVKEIRRLLDSGAATRKELAKKFNVGRTCIDDVYNRKTWRNVE